MDKFGILAILDAKPGKEKEVETFLRSAQALAEKEEGTTTWFAVHIASQRYAIFDTFADEKGRDAHLNGEIAKNLFSRAMELFESEPEVHNLTILAEKVPGAQQKGARAQTS
jgi:quinol monooxygenase YgiN